MKLGLLLCALVACGDSKPKPAPEAPPEPEPAEAAGGVEPDWQLRIPDIPGTGVLTWVNGPALVDGELRVGSSAIGVAAVEPTFGKILWQRKDAGPFEKRPSDPDELARAEIGAHDVVVTRTHVSKIRRADGEVAWSHALEEEIDVGASNPVVIDWAVALVADQRLFALDWNTGRLAWRAESRFAHALVGAGKLVRAIALDDGIGPVLVDEKGGVRPGRETVPGNQVLAAAWDGTKWIAADDIERKPEVAVVVRKDTTLLHDAVVAFSSRGTLLWQWDLPRPDGPRVDPVGVTIADAAVFVFYDGRYLVRLPL